MLALAVLFSLARGQTVLKVPATMTVAKKPAGFLVPCDLGSLRLGGALFLVALSFCLCLCTLGDSCSFLFGLATFSVFCTLTGAYLDLELSCCDRSSSSLGCPACLYVLARSCHLLAVPAWSLWLAWGLA